MSGRRDSSKWKRGVMQTKNETDKKCNGLNFPHQSVHDRVQLNWLFGTKWCGGFYVQKKCTRMQKVQHLDYVDCALRVGFVLWRLYATKNESWFTASILFSHEACCTRKCVVNAYNAHMWSSEIPPALSRWKSNTSSIVYLGKRFSEIICWHHAYCPEASTSQTTLFSKST